MLIQNDRRGDLSQAFKSGWNLETQKGENNSVKGKAARAKASWGLDQVEISKETV